MIKSLNITSQFYTVGVVLKRALVFHFKPFLILCFILCFSGTATADSNVLKSPDKQIELIVALENGRVNYRVNLNGNIIIEPSPLGIITDKYDFSESLTFVGSSSIKKIKKQYNLPVGKKNAVNYRANQQIFSFENKEKQQIQFIFRVSNDGIAFSYHLLGNGVVSILSEKSGFDFPTASTAFISPISKGKSGWARTNPSYEDQYHRDMEHGTPSDYGQGWVFPALYKIGNSLAWVLLSETGVDGSYVGSHLSDKSIDGLYTIEFAHVDHNLPQDAVAPTVTLPYTTPWRMIVIAKNLDGIVQSTMAQDLVSPKYKASVQYIPGRVSWSWLPLKDESITYDTQIQFINLAAKMGYEYTLIDGNWDVNIGREKIAQLVQYATAKNVKIILWYNSNGNWNDAPQTPHNCMNTHEARVKEMTWMQKVGVKGIKVDFFGGDKPVEMKRYEDILRDANDFGLYVNFHGTTLPRGWDIMYPNFASAEAVMGMEFISFEQKVADLQPIHCATLPFIRNVVAPMDFTPVMLSTRLGDRWGTGPYRRTTAAFELSLPIVFYSPIQHLGITARSLSLFPDFVTSYLQGVPTVWDETILLSGYPGAEVVMARRSGKRWFLGAINGEAKSKKIRIKLPKSFKGDAYSIQDAKEWNAVTSEFLKVRGDQYLDIHLSPNGGFVLYLK